MRQLVVEYVARRHDRLAGTYEQVRVQHHGDALAAVIERALKVSTKRGQPVGGYADGVWRRWWYEDQAEAGQTQIRINQPLVAEGQEGQE